MNRGNIQLTTQEIAVAHQLASTDTVHQYLALKLTPSTELKIWDVELSFDEVEFLLDTLPIPSTTEPESTRALRTKLQAWLAQYHQLTTA